MRPALPLLLAVACSLLGCASGPEGTRGSGVVVTGDGRFLANTDANERAETVRHIAEDLTAALAPDWTVQVSIDELPIWRASGVQVDDGVWRWEKATAHVVLTGSGTPKVPPEELRTGVERYLAKHAAVATATIAVLAPAAQPMAATQQPAAIGSSTARAYTVQAGDTLADIAMLYYGSTMPWRRIVEANPGLDPANLVPGTVLTIPPLPAAAAATQPAPAPAPEAKPAP